VKANAFGPLGTEKEKHMTNLSEMTDEQIVAHHAAIAVLNDAMRQNMDSAAPNIVTMTCGIIAIADSDRETSFAKQAELLAIIKNYNDFPEENDRYGERDFGAFDWQGVRCNWKIDYFDRHNPQFGSPDPADPAVTCRVLTILTAGEY
jgi:hypothetical protein